MQKNVYEILEKFDSAGSEEEIRKEIFRFYSTSKPELIRVVTEVLLYAFNPKVRFNVPKELPKKYRPMIKVPEGMGYSSLSIELKRAYLFQPENDRYNHNLSDERREEILIQMMESLEPKEALVLHHMLTKSLTSLYKNITLDIIQKTIPDLFKM